MNVVTELEASCFRDRAFDFLDLNAKQLQALEVLTDNVTATLLFGGGANGGKSWLGCVWLLYSALAYPETRWFVGREELKRIRESTLITFHKVARWAGIAPEVFRYNGQDHYIQFENGSRIDLLDLKLLPSDPLFERYGSTEYTGGWIEEGGEVDFGAFDTLKTRIGRQLNDKHGLLGKMLVTCNPKKNWLYREIYKPFREGTLQAGIRFIQSLIGDNPKRESGSIEKLESLTDKTQKQRLLFGNWEYDDDPSALMDYDSITDAFNNAHVPEDDRARAIICDVARLGDDRTVIRIWSGWVLIATIVTEKQKTDATARLLVDLATRYAVPRSRIVIDEDGVGGGVVDHVPGALGFVNGSTAVHVAGQTANYVNLKSQCYFRFADRVNERKVWLKEYGAEDDKARTVEELEQVRRKNPDGDGKLAVIPKDQMKQSLGRSPDYADSLMMREYLDLFVSRSRVLPNPWCRSA